MRLKTFFTCIAIGILTTNTTMAQAPWLRADNIDEVLNAMTLEEKAHLLCGGAEDFSALGAVGGAQSRQVPGAAGSTIPIDRLGIPATILPDGPARVRTDTTRNGDKEDILRNCIPYWHMPCFDMEHQLGRPCPAAQ